MVHRRLLAALAQELRKEVAPDHPLSAVGWKIVGSGAPVRDDVLLALSDGTVAITHLTWKRGQEEPPWPSTVIVSGLDQFNDELIDRGYDVL